MNRAAAFAAALSGLPGMGPASLVRILERHEPEAAWEAVRSGRIERPPRRRAAPGTGQLSMDEGPASSTPTWAAAAGRVDPLSWWAGHHRAGVRVTWRGQPEYPAALIEDPQPPGVLFWRGDLAVLDRPTVAIVGTRNATPDGRAIAFDLGRDLTAAGLCVVSGLALGIDGAAHRGALESVARPGSGAPAGVAASGVDVPYPRSHTDLWRRVSEAGVMVSETLPGRPAQAWRFPARNRVIAGLARLVVVVESHVRGGSLLTAEAALERGVDVRVVPGPVRSPASAGSNQLLYDGPGPVRHARDVLDALGILEPDPDQTGRPAGPARAQPPPVQPGEAAVLAAIGRRPATVGAIMARSGLDAPAVAAALQSLAGRGSVVHAGGWWSPM